MTKLPALTVSDLYECLLLQASLVPAVVGVSAVLGVLLLASLSFDRSKLLAVANTTVLLVLLRE
jgi:hypothetical protein